jgi:Domain of unknown function (DUF4157)
MTTHEPIQRPEGRAVAPSEQGRPSMAPASNRLLTLQRAGGNAAVGALLRAGIARAKLRVAPANDPLEEEADRAADAIASDAPCSCAGGGTCDKCQKKSVDVMRTATDAGSPDMELSGAAESVVRNVGPGRPLEPSTRAPFENHFGRDLSSVRIHDGPAASEAAESIQARAFTLGNSIAFHSGEFSPQSQQGQHLLAHELAHTVQQGAGSGTIAPKVQRDLAVPTQSDPVQTDPTPGSPEQKSATQADASSKKGKMVGQLSDLKGRFASANQLAVQPDDLEAVNTNLAKISDRHPDQPRLPSIKPKAAASAAGGALLFGEEALVLVGDAIAALIALILTLTLLEILLIIAVVALIIANLVLFFKRHTTRPLRDKVPWTPGVPTAPAAPTRPAPAPETQPAPEPAPQPQSAPKPEPVPEPAAQPRPVPEPVPEPAPKPDPVPEPAKPPLPPPDWTEPDDDDDKPYPFRWDPNIQVREALRTGGIVGSLEFARGTPAPPTLNSREAHHVWPKYIGGPEQQPLMGVYAHIHRNELHSQLLIFLMSRFNISGFTTDPRNFAFITRLRDEPALRAQVAAALRAFFGIMNLQTSPPIPPAAYEPGIAVALKDLTP